MTTGEKIKKYRRNANLTQNGLAEKVDLPLVRIQQYEIGYRTPKKEQLEKFADVLGVDVGYLLGTETYNTIHAEEYIKDVVSEYGEEFVLEILKKLES